MIKQKEIQIEKINSEEMPYEFIINQFVKDYTQDEYYIYTGVPIKKQGWLLHITIVPEQMLSLLKVILPIFKDSNILLKIAKSKSVVSKLNSGILGNYKIGKAITAFLETEEFINPLLDDLLILTKDFYGPQILTDFYIGSNLYVRYGSYIPQIMTDDLDNKIRVIKDGTGELIRDSYYIPPIIPYNINNPFLKFISTTQENKHSILIENKYFPIKILKSDIKGDVWKALYLKKGYIPSWVILKQGRKGMFIDDKGRDVRNRLHWQYKIGKQIENLIPMPNVIDLIDREDYTFLVLEYINGTKTLEETINSISIQKTWFDLERFQQTKILSLLLEIIRNIQLLHKNNFVHRDISITNFLVKKNKRIKLIDFELIYDIDRNDPNPAFGIGTRGYMSPNQQEEGIPVLSDDCYSIGALAFAMMTSIDPNLFLSNKEISNFEKIHFHIQNKQIATFITKCLSDNNLARPKIDDILKEVENYSNILNIKECNEYKFKDNKREIIDTIGESINSLGSDLMTFNNIWQTPIVNEFGNDVYPLQDKTQYICIYKGVAGILYSLLRLKDSGYDISPALLNINYSVDFIKRTALDQTSLLTPSLYYGTSGIALIICKLLDSNFLSLTNDILKQITLYLSLPSKQNSLIFGSAGRGMAILQCNNYLSQDFTSYSLTNIASTLINTQNKNGSWTENDSGNLKNENITGFGYGISGITYFLYSYYSSSPNSIVYQSAEKSLQYLKKVLIKSGAKLEWNLSNKNKNKDMWWCQGGPGIALAFLKGYEITKKIEYLKIAETALLTINQRIVSNSLSQCHGLAGLGEIYIEAYRVTRNDIWLKRSKWIADFILNVKRQIESNKTIWHTDKSRAPHPDFMTGNSGIIHFLLRFCEPDKFGFPLLS